MKKFSMTAFCEEKPLNHGFSNEEAIKLIAQAGFDGVFMSFQNEHLSGGGISTFCKL